jgi:hypothetical protein
VGAGAGGANDKVKKPGTSTSSESPATTQNQNFFPNNPEEKKGQSLQELMADGDISNSGMTD